MGPIFKFNWRAGWIRRYEIALWTIFLGGPILGWCVRQREYFSAPIELVLYHHLFDFVGIPFTALALLEAGEILLGRQRKRTGRLGEPSPGWWPPLAVAISLVIWLVVEFKQITGGFVPYRDDPTTWQDAAVNRIIDIMGRVFDWWDILTEAIAFVVTLYCVIRSRQVRQRAGLPPAW